MTREEFFKIIDKEIDFEDREKIEKETDARFYDAISEKCEYYSKN